VELTPETVSELWSRFGGFHDSVIRAIELRPETASAHVDLDAEDISEGGGWHRVRFAFEGICEWRVEQIHSDMVVIYEARTAEVDGLVFVDFDAATMAERPTADDFRGSCAFIAAQRVGVTTSPL
jgi:hypothetical protein